MRYRSAGDEAAFFNWLQSISGIKAARGVGRELHIELHSQQLTQESHRELLALYERYGGEMSELAMFATPGNAHWFTDPLSPWFEKVFPGGRRGG